MCKHAPLVLLFVWGPFNRANCAWYDFPGEQAVSLEKVNLLESLQMATWEAAAQFIFQPQYTDNLTTSVKEPLQKQFKVALVTLNNNLYYFRKVVTLVTKTVIMKGFFWCWRLIV